MSGGERKKRDKGHGWEEAGAEFYQERYPTAIEADLQQALQDPSQITTLLPSKKSRVATATAKRIKHEARTTLRRRTSTRSYYTNTARRMSMNIHDAAASMLPDLSENLSNEESTWEEMMQIKAMPVCMAQKIQLKKQLQSATKLRLQGFEQIKWQHRMIYQQFRIKMKEAYSKMELWSSSLKNIRGNFGIGIATYFLFIKWILFLNLVLFSIIIVFLVLPTIFLETPESKVCNTTNPHSIACCSEIYNNVSTTKANSIIDLILEISLISDTLFFYGGYSHEIYTDKYNHTFFYDTALAYLSSMTAVYVLSLLILLKSAAKGIRERVAEGEGQFYQYCNVVFGGWDYCINNKKAAANKHRSIYNEFKLYLESERLEDEKHGRTREEKLKLYSIRVFINIFIILILKSCSTLLYFITKLSFENLNGKHNETDIEYMSYISFGTFSQAFFEFLPSALIVCMNILIPFLFRYLVNLEHYGPVFAIRITLFRAILLRFSILTLFVITLYKTVVDEIENKKCELIEKRYLCWETFVGQQFLKLYLTDLTSQFFVTFFVNLPRSLLGRNSENKLLKFIGQQPFDLNKHVLDIVYSQTICWLGCFLVPVLPLVAAIGTFFLFYIKKFACLVNSTPSNQIHKASRSTSLFILILLTAYAFAVIPIIYYITQLNPSKSCGPFKGLDTIWVLMVTTFTRLPKPIQSLFYYLSTAGFGVSVIIILFLLLYYYYVVSKTNKQMVSVLKSQLVLEGHDKQFLLNRLSAFIKQQQDQNKCHHEANDLGTSS